MNENDLLEAVASILVRGYKPQGLVQTLPQSSPWDLEVARLVIAQVRKHDLVPLVAEPTTREALMETIRTAQKVGLNNWALAVSTNPDTTYTTEPKEPYEIVAIADAVMVLLSSSGVVEKMAEKAVELDPYPWYSGRTGSRYTSHSDIPLTGEFRPRPGFSRSRDDYKGGTE